MNRTKYLKNSVGDKVNLQEKLAGKTEMLFCETEEWDKEHTVTQWKPGFFDFKPIINCSDFIQCRHELEQVNEDPLQ